ncbi:MAG: hypothetical protein A2X48_04950 [Lentisphaerae bacterium GWF2_49_21]|nr:MAG: hypothetical protein A2X48_04950 [Lentisphaerae bacterium GWF2_49_21]
MALALWVAIVVVEVVKGGRWAWSLQYILLSTPMAVLVTFLLCLFRVARKKPLSYGTLLAGPFSSALLVMLCDLFYYDGGDIFTLGYWHNLKGGLLGVLFELALVGGVCVLPAIAIVVYYRSKTDEAPMDEQHRTVIPESLVQTWRWAIELFCSSLVLLYWILRYGAPAMEDQVMLINFGSSFMILLLVTSVPSLRHHWRHGLFGLVVFFAWFVSLFCFPPLR